MFKMMSNVSPKMKKFLAVVLSVLCIGTTMIPFAFASTAEEPVTLSSDAAIAAAKDLFAQVTTIVNFTNVAKVLAIGLGSVLGIWLAWWGLRKLVRMIVKVLERGKISM